MQCFMVTAKWGTDRIEDGDDESTTEKVEENNTAKECDVEDKISYFGSFEFLMLISEVSYKQLKKWKIM